MFSVIINFISFIIEASSLLEVQIFYYLSAGKSIISLRICMVVYFYLFILNRIFNLNNIQLRDKYVWVCVRSLCYKCFSCFNPLIYLGY